MRKQWARLQASVKGHDRVIIRHGLCGLPMYIDWHDAGISKRLALTGLHETIPAQAFAQRLKPGQTILEVGANIGYYALLEASVIGETGHIIAVEPGPKNLALLKRNIALNSLGQIIKPYHAAVSNSRGPIRLSLSEASNCHRVRSAQGNNGAGAYVEVPGTTGDVLIEELLGSDGRVDVIRMDVEGHEVQVLQGLEKTLSSNQPLIIYIEIHPDLIRAEAGDSEYQRFLSQLQSYGFRLDAAFRHWASKVIRHVETWSEIEQADQACLCILTRG